ncbi:amidohydrolase family protein [Egicoccus sp. AB-alg2]|uniref:amidohydrolase family protein n=1 Tax=Egicoccus sp. AB-alg2 TaxID=3242693 RepID=UPI00359DF47C
MPVIDVHTHMLVDGYVERLAAHGGRYEVRQVAEHHNGHRDPIIAIRDLDYGVNAPWSAMYDWELRLRKMDEAGVDVALVSLTAPQANWGDAEVSTGTAAMVNDALAEQHAQNPDRIRFLATLPWPHPDRAVVELRRAAGQGAVGVTVLANIDGVTLAAPEFEPVWREIAELELPVLIHPTAPPGVEQIARHGLHNAVGFHFDTTHALERLVALGHLERYPTLRVIGSHAGGFLPFVLGRMEMYRTVSTRSPRDYPGQLFVDSLAFSPEALDLTVRKMGAEHVLFGSDYPHNGDVDRMARFLGMVDALSPDEQAAVRGDTAAKLFTR